MNALILSVFQFNLCNINKLKHKKNLLILFCNFLTIVYFVLNSKINIKIIF